MLKALNSNSNELGSGSKGPPTDFSLILVKTLTSPLSQFPISMVGTVNCYFEVVL